MLKTLSARWLSTILILWSALASADDWQVLQDSAKALMDEGQYRLALEPATKALSIAEKSSGAPGVAPQLTLATSLALVGDIRTYLGQLTTAEPLLKRALAIREGKAGADEATVAQSLQSLGRLYIAQKRYELSRPVMERTVSIRERVLGPDHPDLARSLTNLALTYPDKPFGEPEKLYLRAAAIFEKSPLADQVDGFKNKLGLARLYYLNNRSQEAAAICAESLPLLEKQRGRDHPDVARALDMCAYLDFRNSDAMLLRALAIREKTLGPEDPAVGRSLVRVGGEYYGKRKTVEAQPLLERAVRVLEKEAEAGDDNLQMAIVTLAEIHYRNREFDKAIALFERAAAVKANDPNQKPRLDDQNYRHLAASYSELRQFAKAGKLYSRLLDDADKRNQQTDLTLANDLSDMYIALGQFTEAASLNEEILAAKKAGYKKTDHPDIATSLYQLAKIYTLLGRSDDARTARSQANAIRTKNLGQEEGGLDGKNCDLMVPPIGSARGAFPPHAHKMRMYPLAPGPAYSGCLWIWISYDSKTSLDYRVVAMYESGTPVLYRESMDTFRSVTTCSYRDGVVTRTASTKKGDPWERYCRNAAELRQLLTITPPEDDWWEFW